MLNIEYFETMAETPFMSLDMNLINSGAEIELNQLDLRDHMANLLGQEGRKYADTVEVVA